MSVTTTNSRIQYTSGGEATFTVNFEFPTDASLRVYVNGVLKSLSTHYTAIGAGNENGGSITFTAGNIPAAGSKITIAREVARSRVGRDYQQNGKLSSTSLNKDIDTLWFVAQELDTKANIGLGLDITDASGFNTTLPTPMARKTLVVNTAGTGFEWSTDNYQDQLANVTAQTAIATDQAGIATAQAVIATGKATDAGNSATQSALSAADAHASAIQAASAVSGGIKVSGSDTLTNYLATKLVAGSGISMTTVNPGGNESLRLDVALITTNTTLSVGNGQTYSTLNAAYAYLTDKRILPGVTVTIQINGWVTETVATTINHPDARSIVITGAAAPTTTTVTSVSSIAANTVPNYYVTLNVGSTANMAVGDLVNVGWGSGNNYTSCVRGIAVVNQIISSTQVKLSREISYGYSYPANVTSATATSGTITIFKHGVSFANTNARIYLDNGSSPVTLSNIALKGDSNTDGVIRVNQGMIGSVKVSGSVAINGNQRSVMGDTGGAIDFTISNGGMFTCRAFEINCPGTTIINNSSLWISNRLVIGNGHNLVSTFGGNVYANGGSGNIINSSTCVFTNLYCNCTNGAGITVTNSRVYVDNGAFSYSAGNGFTCENSVVYANGASGEANGNSGVGFDIRNSIARVGGNAQSNTGTGFNIHRNSTVLLNGPNATSNVGGGIYVAYGSTAHVSGGTVQTNTGFGIKAHYSSGVTVDSVTMGTTAPQTSDLTASNNSSIDRIAGTYAGLSPAAQTVGNLNSYIS